MSDQKLLSSRPSKWEETFILKRIGDEDIKLTLQERNAILGALQAGSRFVQVRRYTIMVNAIKSIDPEFGEQNIPPRPQEQKAYDVIDGKAMLKITNQGELDEWDRTFGNRRGITVV